MGMGVSYTYRVFFVFKLKWFRLDMSEDLKEVHDWSIARIKEEGNDFCERKGLQSYCEKDTRFSL